MLIFVLVAVILIVVVVIFFQTKLNSDQGGGNNLPANSRKPMPADQRTSLFSFSPSGKTSDAVKSLNESEATTAEDPNQVWPFLLQLLDLRNDPLYWLKLLKARYAKFENLEIEYLENALKFNSQFVTGNITAQDGSQLLDPGSASVTQEQIEGGQVMHKFLPQVISGDSVLMGEYGFVCRVFYSKGGFEYNPSGSVVAISDHGFFAVCTGTLLAPRIVITAAHCVVDPARKSNPDRQLTRNDFNKHFCIHVGYVNETDARAMGLRSPDFWKTRQAIVSDVAFFPLYVPSMYLGDIAIFFLDKDIEFSRYVFPCALPSTNLIWENQVGTGVGWGRVIDNADLASKRTPVLLQHQLKMQPFSSDANSTYCRDLKRSGVNSPAFFGAVCNISQNENQSFCFGDSGGPTFFKPSGANRNHTLVSITSFSESSSCSSLYPTISALVPNYLGWIKKTIQSRNFQ